MVLLSPMPEYFLVQPSTGRLACVTFGEDSFRFYCLLACCIGAKNGTASFAGDTFQNAYRKCHVENNVSLELFHRDYQKKTNLPLGLPCIGCSSHSRMSPLPPDACPPDNAKTRLLQNGPDVETRTSREVGRSSVL